MNQQLNHLILFRIWKNLVFTCALVLTTTVSFSQVSNSGIGLNNGQAPEATLHLYGPGNLGSGSRIIFGDDIQGGGIRAYIAEFGWQNDPPSDSDRIELHGQSGVYFTTGVDVNNINTAGIFTAASYSMLMNLDNMDW